MADEVTFPSMITATVSSSSTRDESKSGMGCFITFCEDYAPISPRSEKSASLLSIWGRSNRLLGNDPTVSKSGPVSRFIGGGGDP